VDALDPSTQSEEEEELRTDRINRPDDEFGGLDDDHTRDPGDKSKNSRHDQNNYGNSGGHNMRTNSAAFVNENAADHSSSSESDDSSSDATESDASDTSGGDDSEGGDESDEICTTFRYWNDRLG
jgi:hypothetical protein